MAKKRSALPKQIMGVRLPKSLRRSAVADLVASPLGQNLIAEVIYHAGAAFAGDSKAAKKSLKRVKRGALGTGHAAANLAEDGAALLVYALREAAVHFVKVVREAGEGAKDLTDAALQREDDKMPTPDYVKH
jgi:hypothetical protein